MSNEQMGSDKETPPPYYIGIEGGGTTTRLLVQRGDETPEYFERPISLKVRDGDFAASAEKLREVLADVAKTFKGSFVTFRSRSEPDRDLKVTATIAIGLSGMSREEDQVSLEAAIHALPEFAKAKLHIESDATMTLKAVLPEAVDERSFPEEGILLIAGTGSVIFYQPLGQSPRRIGGWGPFLSDDGSGYRIGLRSLRRYLWMLDGVYPPDPLTERIGARLIERGLTPPDDRAEITKLAESDRTFVASIARDAFEAASAVATGGTIVPDSAKQIKDMIHEELIELITQIFPIFFKGVMSGNMPYKLFFAGSIAKHPITVAALQNSFETTDVTPILVDDSAPAMKALEIAKKMSKP
jgi:N-acetylglucosamine kinase-like BadF-type ATPase